MINSQISIEFIVAVWCKDVFPLEAIRWMLYATSGAFSRVHVDAAGFNTFVTMKQGVKVWYIAVPPKDKDGNDIPISGSLFDFNY